MSHLAKYNFVYNSDPLGSLVLSGETKSAEMEVRVQFPPKVVSIEKSVIRSS